MVFFYLISRGKFHDLQQGDVSSHNTQQNAMRKCFFLLTEHWHGHRRHEQQTVSLALEHLQDIPEKNVIQMKHRVMKNQHEIKINPIYWTLQYKYMLLVLSRPLLKIPKQNNSNRRKNKSSNYVVFLFENMSNIGSKKGF